jgi:hypothetical protein
MEIIIPRENGRYLYLEYRKKFYTKCDVSGSNCNQNAPGVYVWDVTAGQPPRVFRYWAQPGRSGGNGPYFNGIGPLPTVFSPGLQLEPHVRLVVTNHITSDYSTVSVNFN